MPRLLNSRLGWHYLHPHRLTQPYCSAALSCACRNPSANSSAENVPNSPCFRHRNLILSAPAAISSSPWHSVHRICTRTVFPSGLIFMENLISILPPFFRTAHSIFCLPYVRQQSNSESGQWPISCESFVQVVLWLVKRSCCTATLGRASTRDRTMYQPHRNRSPAKPRRVWLIYPPRPFSNPGPNFSNSSLNFFGGSHWRKSGM